MLRRLLLITGLLCGLVVVPALASAQVMTYTDAAIQAPNGPYDTVMVYGWAAANGHEPGATVLLDGQPQIGPIVGRMERDDARDWVVVNQGWSLPTTTTDCGYATDACLGLGTVLDVTALSPGWHWVAYVAYVFTGDPHDALWYANSNIVWFYKE
jgi:hypothetical protein